MFKRIEDGVVLYTNARGSCQCLGEISDAPVIYALPSMHCLGKVERRYNIINDRALGPLSINRDVQSSSMFIERSSTFISQ